VANLLVSSAYLGTLRPAEGTDPLLTVAVAGPSSRGPRLTLRVAPRTARLFRVTDAVVRFRIVVVLGIAAVTLATYFATRDLGWTGAAYFVTSLVFLLEIRGRLKGYPMILAGGKDVALIGFDGSAARRWVEANPPGSIRFQPPDAAPALRLPLGRWGLVLGLYTLIGLAIAALVLRHPSLPALFTVVLGLMVVEWLAIWLNWIKTPARAEPGFLMALPVLGDLVTGSTLRVFTLLPVLIAADVALWTL
jgi:hypothetical protein